MGASDKTPRSKIRVLVVDDHPIVRQGIRGVLEQQPDMVLCGEAEDAGDALKAIAATRPDVVILDISLRGSDGLDVTKSIRARDTKLPVLVMSMHSESLYAGRALRAGANGYIMKTEVAENLVPAVRHILAGDIYLSEHARQSILLEVRGGGGGTASPLKRLSDRVLEVFRMIGDGLSTRKIAGELHLSVKTIETHRAHIKEKLGLKTAAEVVRYAVQFSDG